MKVLFVQLPVQDPEGEDSRANVPLAAGYLAAYAESQNLLARSQWSILDGTTSAYGSDTAIIEAIVASEADLVCFSLYTWNLERSLFIASKAKERLPRSRFIAGGPEIAEGMPIMDRSPFNALVLGEGELAFAEILKDMEKHRPLARLYKAKELLDLATLPSPYLAGTLPLNKDKPVHIETLRGCPYRCAYCFYGKQYPVLRYFPEDEVISLIRRASQTGVSEIYLMDPSFQYGDRASGLLKEISLVNTAAIPIHAELRLDMAG